MMVSKRRVVFISPCFNVVTNNCTDWWVCTNCSTRLLVAQWRIPLVSKSTCSINIRTRRTSIINHRRHWWLLHSHWWVVTMSSRWGMVSRWLRWYECSICIWDIDTSLTGHMRQILSLLPLISVVESRLISLIVLFIICIWIYSLNRSSIIKLASHTLILACSSYLINILRCITNFNFSNCRFIVCIFSRTYSSLRWRRSTS